ncbi:hypothetical protein SAMN05421541_101140 [Actinoplanes philippinensis]|uniref:Uncharacterized protein n=2 Tax=Actinoplanes philippinensis TaxID=35752 RepID=A0A1I1ZML6_9ACTN|nr:hypothetical protein SAMN05421541_101140 [Actinoplanes philippinensis]
MLSLPATAIDVGEDGEDERNWAAPISCTLTRLDGDFPLHLDIYFDDSVAAPSEADAAAWMAARLNTVVAYKSVPLPPSAYWLVGPDGQRTRARLLDEDENGDLLSSGRRVAAVESVIPTLSGVPVRPLPEVIHEFHMRTPITDQLRTVPGSATESPIGDLSYWESMVVRLVSGWPPDGWYPPDYYREGLENRDALAAAEPELPEPARTAFMAALIEVDRLFAEATVDDGGQALASLTGPVPDRWWWHRITDPAPWHRMPGATG